MSLLGRQSAHIERAYPDWIAGEDGGFCVPEGAPISVLLPVYNPPVALLRAAIGSVVAQTYRHWDLCIADDGSAPAIAAELAAWVAFDPRIRMVRLPGNAGIAAATNAALAMARGDFVALLDHDDTLAPHALARIAGAIAETPDAGVIFSDEDQLIGRMRCRPYFKPGWNPDLLLGQNAVSHLGVYRRSLMEQIGGLRDGFDGSQDYDLALRATAAVPPFQVRHVPHVLYHWRQHGRSFSSRRLATCQASARAALTERLGAQGRPEPLPELPLWTRIAFAIPSSAPLVSVILPGAAQMPGDPLYPSVEIVADAEAASGGVLLCLAAGLVPMRPGWLRELVGQALRPEIGCAGARLDQPGGCVAHAGFTLDPLEIAQTLAPRAEAGDPGYVGQFLLARTVSAVSRDCLAIRADLFRQAGGFDARAGTYADIDLCLRLAERGLRCVWTPQARLGYREVPRAPADPAGAAYMRQRWGESLARDPYANPNLVIRDGNLGLADGRTHTPQRPARP
jgi:GT2 family glycosyltransferase